MNNKILQILLVPVFLILGMWATNYIVTLPAFFQIYAGALAVLLAFLLLYARNLPFDFKFLALLLLGYALGGKGFAYISPFDPFYISEITLVICIVGLIARWFQRVPVFPTHIHWVVFGWMSLTAIYLMRDLPQYRLDAIRDSTIAYYGLYFFSAYAMFQNPDIDKAFSKVLKWMVVFSYISAIIIISGVYIKYISAFPVLMNVIFPHTDAFLPLVSAGAIYGIMQGTSKRSIALVAGGLLGIVLLLLSKTAGIFCFGCSFMFLIIFARRGELLFASIGMAALTGITVAILFVGESKFLKEHILESDQIRTISDLGNASGETNDSTSDWRLSWWRTIAEDTFEHNPFLGSGMGSDITTHFLETILGNADTENTARYPHSILFNVLGRMGIVGLLAFLIMFGTFLRLSYQFVRRNLTMREIDSSALIAFATFFSGLANSLIQATYEPPYAAIIHWVCLGYVVSYHYRSRVPPQPQTALQS